MAYDYNGKNTVATCAKQSAYMLMLLLNLKLWRFVFIAIPISLLLSNFYVLPWLAGNLAGREVKRPIVFYGARDFTSSQAKVLVERSAFKSEADAASAIVTKEGGEKADWVEYCDSASSCRERLIHQTDGFVVAHLRYSSSPQASRNVLDCLAGQYSHLMCAFLYHVMIQSMHSKSQGRSMRSVQLFEVRSTKPSGEDKDGAVNLETPNKTAALPQSECKEWISDGSFERLMNFGVPYTVVFAAAGVSLYLLISTLSCIRMLKTDGFLQQQFRSGLPVSAYWLAVWLITIVECFLFAGVFVTAQAIQCLGVYSLVAVLQLYAFVMIFFINLAALMFLLEMLLSSLLVTSIFAISLIAGLAAAFTGDEQLTSTAQFTLFIFPPMFNKEYIADLMISEAERLRTGLSMPEGKAGQLSNIFAANFIFMLAILLLLFYMDFLLKGGNGLCLPPFFSIMAEFWFPKALRNAYGLSSTDSEAAESEPHIEPVPGATPVVLIDSVSKSYYDVRSCCCEETPLVLDKLSCKIYRGQITALVGHNGAGKSTLIKILTGEEEPTSGSASIGGCLVTNPLQRLSIARNVSVCPQFDILCSSLTVMECIRCTLISRSLGDTSRLNKVRGMLHSLGLEGKENMLSSDLSGGQKRKLSTILALVGGCDVVFLDEPTSGLDPVSRRQLWQLLQEEKCCRSIILCTQYMDEADILADRKIFLCGGRIVCAGSSVFLKRAFGCCFILNVSLRSKDDVGTLLAKLNDVRVKRHEETELQLEVPSLNLDVLTQAVGVLETSEEIKAFSLSEASLEDMYMRLSGMDSHDIIRAFRLGTLTLSHDPDDSETLPDEQVPGKSQPKFESCHVMRPTVARQFGALLSVNFKRQLRVRSNCMCRFFIPALLLAVICISSVVFMDSVISSVNDPIQSQMDIRTDPSNIRLSQFGSGHLATVCVIDETPSAIHSQGCSALALHHIQDARQPIVLQKSPSQSLREFMSQSSTREKMLQRLRAGGWIENDGTITPCAIYYASSWIIGTPNEDRSIGIGVFIGENEFENTLHIYRRALTKIFELFQFAEVSNTTALSYVQPLGAPMSIGVSLIAFLYAISLLPVSFLDDPIEDLTSQVRSYLISTGMSHVAYWINTFVMHWIQYAVCFLLGAGLLMLAEAYRSSYIVFAAFAPAYIFGTVSNLLTIYAVAVATKSKSAIVSGCCNVLALLVPIVIPLLNSQIALQLLVWLVPPAAPVGLIYSCVVYYFYKRELYNSADLEELPGMPESLYMNPDIFYSLLAMPVHIMIMCGLITLVENGSAIRRSITADSSKLDESSQPLNADYDMDEGARLEAERVLGMPRHRKNLLEVRRLRKTYSNGVRAVRGITFGAKAGEVFGLLGTNGAGKSTSMSVIVGEEAVSEGVCEVYLLNYAWLTGREAATIGVIGYCPQHNPLFDSITVTEHLKFYAGIRGLNSGETDRQINRLMTSLGLLPLWDKPAGHLSGGTKRRLCLAIALLGNPSVVIIDEASTGVDPENKRFIWDAIRRISNKQRSIVLTTHNMEEVEALCNRVGIMNKGRMISVGTVPELRKMHGDAYTLELQLDSKAQATSAIAKKKQAIQKTVTEYFKAAKPHEDLSLGLVLQFSVPKATVPKLSDALSWLAANQSRLGVSYWALYQMSLDQVFVKLVKKYNQSVRRRNLDPEDQ